jgi:uncharacterized protein involved in type VI secretion and phage assembly
MNNLAGVYRAVVTDVRDPEGRGRVQLRVPQVTGDEEIWARVLAHAGTAFVPQPGDEVLVAFEAGEPRIPVVLGTLWKSPHIPPE